MADEGEERVAAYRAQQRRLHPLSEPATGGPNYCSREFDAFDSAILRLKIGLGKPLTRSNANLLADDLANAATSFSKLGRCIGMTLAREGGV